MGALNSSNKFQKKLGFPRTEYPFNRLSFRTQQNVAHIEKATRSNQIDLQR